MAKYPLEIESDEGGFVRFNIRGTKAPRTVCFPCVLRPNPETNEGVGCSGFSTNGTALLDTGRQNIRKLVEGESEDVTSCGVIGEIRSRRGVGNSRG